MKKLFEGSLGEGKKMNEKPLRRQEFFLMSSIKFKGFPFNFFKFLLYR